MFNLKKVLRCAFAAGLVGFGASSLMSPASAEELTIGSPAPALDIEHWVQDGNGKFKPVTEFEKGKVYVVEFWATWCGPCIASMPHLVEMQTKFADRGVQIVSISDEDLETVDKFLDREYKARPAKQADDEKAADESGDQPKTYRELTSAYCLTTDPDGSANKDYMQAAGQNGIPCAFVVGKDQKIEWIGHPMSMDKALAQIVDEKWDRDVFAAEFKESKKMGPLMNKIMRLARGGETDEAMTLIDETLAETKSAAGKLQLQSIKVQVLLQDTTIEKFSELITQSYTDHKDNPSFINFVTWSIYEKFASGELDDKALLKASRAAAEQAAESADAASKAAILDTAAHFQFLEGDLKTALKTQAEAVKLADGPVKADIDAFYAELKEKADK